MCFGMVTKSFLFLNTKEGLESLLEKLKTHSLSPENLLCGLEATGSLSFVLSREIT